MILIIIVLISACLLLAIPWLLRWLLWRAGFEQVQISYVRPFRLSNIKLTMRTQLSYFRRICFYMNDLRIFIRNRRLVIQFNQPQLILEADSRHFEEVNSLKSRQESKLMSNLQNILNEALVYRLTSQRSQVVVPSVSSTTSTQSDIASSLKGLVNFCVMLLTQCLEIDVRELAVEITPAANSTETSTIIDQKTLADLSLHTSLITVRFRLNDSQDLECSIRNECLKIDQQSVRYKELYKTIVELNGFETVICLPFTFSFGHSMRKSQIDLSVQAIQFNIVPSNFDEIFDLVTAIGFFQALRDFCVSFEQPTENKIEQPNKEDPPFAQFNIVISKIQVKLTELFEKGIDNQENEEYLSSISEVVATGDKLTVSIMGNSQNLEVAISEITLKLSQYETSSEVLRLGHFLFKVEKSTSGAQNITKLITHDDVVVEAGPLAISSLAKIFRLIIRTRREHYEIQKYRPYLQFYISQQSQIHRTKEALQQLRHQNIGTADILLIWRSSKQAQPSRKSEQPCNSLIYKVNSVTFNLKIKKLQHKAVFNQANFKRVAQRNTIISVLKVSSFDMQLPESLMKQFALAELELYIKQSPIQDQCDVFVNSLSVSQNQSTLIEYLTGFPLLKVLLQISASESNKDDFKRNTQTFNIKKFKFNYLQLLLGIDEVILTSSEEESSARQLSLKVSKVEASIKRTEPISRARFLFIDPSNIKEILEVIKIGSINLGIRGEGTRSKNILIIKNPKITVPQQLVAIGSGIQLAQRTINDLSLYFQAYLKNMSDEVLRQIKFNLQQRIQSPTQWSCRIINLVCIVEDTQWNIASLNYQRVVREYLANQTIYNEQEILNELTRRKRVCGLIELKLSEISAEIGPVDHVQTVEQADMFMGRLGKYDFQLGDVAYFYHFRTKASLTGLVVNIRDYPFQFIKLSSAEFQSQMIQAYMKPTYQENCQFYFMSAEANIGKLDVVAGLNMSSAFYEIVAKANRIMEGFEKSQQQKEDESVWLAQIARLRNKQAHEQIHTKQYTPYWEIVRTRCFFHLKLRKKAYTTLKILTNIYPYSLDCLILTLKEIYFVCDKQKTLLSIHGIDVTKEWPTEVFSAVDIGRFVIQLTVVCRPLINISSHVLFDRNYRHVVHIRKDLLEYLLNLDQLRTDVLHLYGINLRPNKSRFGNIRGEDVEISLIKWFNYAEIAKLAFDNQLHTNRNTLSIWNVVANVNFSVVMRQFNILMSLVDRDETGKEEKQGLQFLIGRSKLKFSLIPHFREVNSQWIIKDGSGKIQTTVGQYYSGLMLHLEQIEELLFMKPTYFRTEDDRSYVDESRINTYFDEYPDIRPISTLPSFPSPKKDYFFMSQALVFIRNHVYHNINGNSFIVKNFFQYENVRAVLSSDMKKVLSKLLTMPSRHNILVRKNLNRDKQSITRLPVPQKRDRSTACVDEQLINRKQGLLQRFRRAVRMIIKSRKQQKIIEIVQKIKLDFLFVLNKPQFNIFYEEKQSQVILTTLQSCFIELKKEFLVYDTFGLDPKICLYFRFNSFQIWTSEDCESIKWVTPVAVQELHVRQILQSKQAVFSLIAYELPMCDLNFEMTIQEILANKLSEQELQERKYKWAKEQRIKKFDLQFKQVKSQIDRGQKRVLLNIVQFMILAASSKKRFVEEVKLSQAKNNQLKIYGRTKILQKLIKKACKNVVQNTPRLEASFKFDMNRAVIDLVNRESVGEICFLTLHTEKIGVEFKAFNYNYSQFFCQIEEIEIGNDYRVVLSMNHLGRTAALFQSHVYNQSLFDKDISWPYHKLLAIKLNPIKFRFTDELYEQIYEYAFKNMKEQAITLTKYRYPDDIEEYYNRIVIEPIKVQLWYRSSNILKRMDGISVVLDEFSKGNKFAVKKTIFDYWVKFIIKQLTRQIFSVLGQRLFGGDQDSDSEEEAIYR